MAFLGPGISWHGWGGLHRDEGLCDDGAMSGLLLRLLAILIVAAFYWQFLCLLSGRNEPWDAPLYWTVAYPVSMLLAAMAGWVLKRKGWMAGFVVTLVQLPIMMINAGTGPLWVVGLIYLCVMAIPVAAVSALAGRMAVKAS